MDEQQKAQILTSVEIAKWIKKTVAPNLNVNSLAQQIRQYGRQKVKERDKQWKLLIEPFQISFPDLVNLFDQLPEPELE